MTILHGFLALGEVWLGYELIRVNWALIHVDGSFLMSRTPM